MELRGSNPDLLGAIQALSQLSYSPVRRARKLTPLLSFSKQLPIIGSTLFSNC